MARSNMVNVIEHCQVAPPPATVVGGGKSLPLTFFDLPWIHMPLIEHLLFYKFPYSKDHFMNTTIPSLKHSLSLTLKHFYSLAGKLTFPPNSGKPEIRYVDGDSVSLIFAESSNDFNNLTGNHARNVGEFRPLVPQLPPMSIMSEMLVVPLLAIQVTLFPNVGICVGFAMHHLIGDGNAFTGFIRSWASITKLGGDEAFINSGSLPIYDRSVIKDPNGLDTIFWSQEGQRKFEGSHPQNPPADTVQATFVMGRIHVQKLKKWVLTQNPRLSHVSTFTVTCAYVWACMVKARVRSGEEVGEAELEHFVFGADCRALLDPPIPSTYMGNCLAPCFATAKCTQLAGKDGFLIAAEVIGKAIQERLHNEEGVLKGAENWISDLGSLMGRGKIIGVAGSPRFAIYEMEFGWGKPKKSEVVSVGASGSMSLNECKDGEGGLEIGLSFPKIKMEAFAATFADGLQAF